MTILIVGATGQLGQELIRQTQNMHATVYAPDRQAMDITNFLQVQEAMAAHHPSIVINAAAYTDVDGAESEPLRSFAINATGVEHLAQACSKRGIALLHVSSDYVFDGKKGTPYGEEDALAPLNVYGRSKAQGEEKIRALLREHIILRTSWLYSAVGRNFVKTMLALSRTKKEINVVADQYGCPTCAADVAEVLLTVAGRIAGGSPICWGTFHYCGQGVTTWYEFAATIIDIAKQHDSSVAARVNPIPTDQYPTQAQRPAYAVLDCSRIKKILKISPKPWKQRLIQTIAKIYADSGF